MRYASLSLTLAASFIVGSCTDENLSRLSPKLDISAYETDETFYASVDNDNEIIDLGQVPLFATKNAIFRLDNPTNKVLNVSQVSYSETTGERWLEPSISPPVEPDSDLDKSTKLDFAIGPGGTAYLTVPYNPFVEGDHTAVLTFESDAANGKVLTATVKAKGVFTGAPTLEVEYNGYHGPSPSDCVDVEGDGRIDGCVIPPTNALNFGNIGLGGEGTARLVLRNLAQCTPYAGISACDLCKITISQDPTRQGIGLGFKPGTNEANLFAFEGSTATPFDILQRNLNPDDGCNASGEIRFLLRFRAPPVDGEYHATIIVESNDPTRPLIEIPVVGSARNAPVAIAKFKVYNPLNPSDTQFTDPAHIEPLSKVYFDGRDSYDPRDPADPLLIGTYLWAVESYPTNADPGMFQLSGQNSSLFNFFLPVAGHYVVKLTVWNTDGIMSGDTEQCRVEFDVIYGEGIHVELSWDNASNDQDLHMTFQNQDDRVCNTPWDCHWLNKRPIWFSSAGAGVGPNPWLDIDDTNGLGPEHIRIKTPQPGTYRVYVHYFGDYTAAGNTPTRNTIRIYLNSIQAAEYRRTITTEKSVWAVADVTWNADGTSLVTPYPSNASGEVGSVATMTSCSSPGWDFP